MSNDQILRLPPGRVWLSIDVERAVVGSDRQAVGAFDLGLGQNAHDFAVLVNAVDGLVGHFEGAAIGAVEGICKPDAALAVDDDVVGAVVPLAFETIGQDVNCAGFQVGTDEPAAAGWAEFCALTTNQATDSIERIAIGAAAVLSEDRKRSAGCHPIDVITDDVAEKEVAVAVERRPFE